jgi:hypothetical protein
MRTLLFMWLGVAAERSGWSHDWVHEEGGIARVWQNMAAGGRCRGRTWADMMKYMVGGGWEHGDAAAGGATHCMGEHFPGR